MSIDEEAAAATVGKAYDSGVNFFDTANAYNRGQAEKSLGRLLADYPRSSLVIATKAWAPMGEGPNDFGLSAKHLREQCHASLRRLGTDYIDLYQCHRPDPETPLEETVRAVEDLARSGKILYWGVSEWPAWLIAQANALADKNHFRPAVSNQPRYSLMYRQPEAELFPYCRENGIGNVVFSPLAHGVLTGKYPPGQPPPAGTRAADPKQNMVMNGLPSLLRTPRSGSPWVTFPVFGSAVTSSTSQSAGFVHGTASSGTTSTIRRASITCIAARSRVRRS